MTKYPSVHVCLPMDQRAARSARQSMRLLEGYVPEDTIQDVNLLVSELVTNSVKHATVLDDQEITLDASPTDHCIRVEVTNQGAARLANQLPEKAAESGWGLLIVTKIASRWGIATNGTTVVWFEIDLHGDTFSMTA